MTLQIAFKDVAGMAGVKPPSAGARYLRDQIARSPDGPARRQAEAEMAKWFVHYRGFATPRSIAAYMAAVEATMLDDATAAARD